MSVSTPTNEEMDELLLACRYGDIEDIKQFVDSFGPDPLDVIRDDSGNTVLHMVSANGHTGEHPLCTSVSALCCITKLIHARCLIDALDYLLQHVTPSLLAVQNNAKSTALHWAALNSHLSVAQKLVGFPRGPGKNLIDVKNAAGRSPLGEAENIAWEEGAKWFVEVMNLDDDGKEEVAQPEDVGDIEVEIQDAEGQVAKVKIASSGSVSGPSQP